MTYTKSLTLSLMADSLSCWILNTLVSTKELVFSYETVTAKHFSFILKQPFPQMYLFFLNRNDSSRLSFWKSSFSHSLNVGPHLWWQHYFATKSTFLTLWLFPFTACLHKGGSSCRNPRGTHRRSSNPMAQVVSGSPTVDLRFKVEKEALF